MQVVEDREDRRQHELNEADKDEIRQCLPQKERRRGRRRESLRIQYLVVQLTRPALIQCGYRRKHQPPPKQPAADLPRNRRKRRWIEREREDHDHEQRKEEHAVDELSRPPLE